MNTLYDKIKAILDNNECSFVLDDYKASVVVKNVLWLLSDPNSKWTVESLRKHLDPGERYKPDGFPFQGTNEEFAAEVKKAEQPYTPNSDEVANLAYSLWEASGKPDGRSDYFWEQALNQLTPRQWYIRSGQLQVSGYGVLNEILTLAYQKATADGLTLSVLTSASLSGFEGTGNDDLLLQTQPQLEKLGLWK